MSNLIEIIQIYNFVLERPHLRKLRNSDKVIELLKEFHVGELDTFILNDRGHLNCRFRRNEGSTVNLLQAPLFEDKDSIAKWLYSQLRS